MQKEIITSLSLVTSSPLFYYYVSTIFAFGMVIGAKYNHKFNGFKQSMTLLAPYTLIIFTTTISRIYETSTRTTVTANAYNSLVTLVLITIIYVLGLFIGHMLDLKGKEVAHKEHREKIDELATN